MDMQKLLLVGRVTRDAEVISAKSGKDFVSFGLAVNRYITKDKEVSQETTFYEVLSFGENKVKAAEEKVKKGDLVFLEGRPEADAYLGKDGTAKASLKVFADNWQVIK